MRKNKSFFAVLLLAAFSISACSMLPNSRPKSSADEEIIESQSSEPVTTSEIKIPEAYQIYQMYLAQGGTMTYEEWLESVRGEPGKDGHSPVVTIGDDGYWYIDGKTTGVKAQGEKGEKGDTGKEGPQGDTGDKGDTGKSAYEQYKEAHPDYNKSEEEWLDDLLNGRLGTQVTHTVSFNTNGGGEIASQTIVHGEKANKPKDPVRAGYTFAGWTYLGEPWSFYGYVVTSDMTLVASWKAIDYVAIFYNDDGTILDQQDNVHYGDRLTYQGETPVKPNQEDHYVYSFTGWDKELTVDGDMVFTAQYSKEYAPYEEKYFNYDGTLLYSRFMTAEMNSVKEAKITWKEKTTPISDGARFEAEDAEFPYGVEKYYSNIASANYYIGCFQGGSVANFTFDCDTNIDVDTAFTIARDGDTLPLSDFWTIKVNGRTVDVSDLTGPRTDGWESFVTIPGPHISLKEGSNTISIRASEPLNVDYFELLNGTYNDVSSLIETPTRPTENNVKYMFHGWDIESQTENTIIYRAHYESCTNGLEFENNKVDVYHGTSKDVVVPAWWDGFRITEIGHHSFQQTGVKSVVLPDTITIIRDGAFFDLTSLTSINLPNSLVKIEGYAFQGCTNLDVTLNEGLVELGNHAFDSAGLKQIIIPSTMKTICDNAFVSVAADYVYLPASVENVQWNAFGTYVGERTMTILCEREYRPSTYDGNWAEGNSVVWGYKGLVEENGLKFALSEIEGVRSATLVSVAKTLEDINVPSTIDGAPVTAVSANAFMGNTVIKTVVIPEGITKIPARFFRGCSSLVSASIPNTVTEIGEEAFADCKKLTSFEMPDSVDTLGRFVFGGCYSLASVKLSNSLTELTDQLFWDCDKLKSVVIPEGVTYIPSRAFDNCDILSSVVMPSTIERIDNQAFTYSWNISYIYCNCTQEQWNALMATYSHDYDNLYMAIPYFYSEEAPTDAGDYWHYVNGVPTEW